MEPYRENYARYLHISFAGGNTRVRWIKVSEGISDQAAKNVEALLIKHLDNKQLVNSNSGIFTHGAATCAPDELKILSNYFIHDIYWEYVEHHQGTAFTKTSALRADRGG